MPVYEGYGTTETSPGASVNLPDIESPYKLRNRTGTVGKAFSGTEFRIVDPDSLDSVPTGEDGLILIGGPQIMKGYLKMPEKTAEVIELIDGYRWYRTGDKGHLDEDGFLTIVDRYSRFAKIGGEMISLTTVEEEILDACNDKNLEIAATCLPALRKGEKIVLLDAREVGQSASGRNSGYAVAHSHFSGGYQKNQIDHYERIDRINQTGLNSLKSIIDKNHIDCDYKDSGIYHMAADQNSSLECDYFVDYLKKLSLIHI